MARNVTYSCDRCGEDVNSNQLFKVLIRHSDGSEVISINGDDEQPEICSGCVESVIQLVKEGWDNQPITPPYQDDSYGHLPSV